MKSYLTILLLSAVICSTTSFAQGSNTVNKIDTTVKPYGPRIAINKLDNQLLAWDKISWKKVAITLSDTATLDFASSGATTVSDLTVAIPGARLGDEVAVGAPHGSVTATGVYYGWVSAANTVTVRFSPKATENPASGVFHVTVFKYYKWR